MRQIIFTGNRGIRVLMFLAGWFCMDAATAQRYDWRSRIDGLVQMADSLSLESQQTFHLNKYTLNDRQVRETWHYTLFKGRVIIFEIHYFVDSSEFVEAYYLDRDEVVCMEQYEIVYPAHDEDRILWGTVGFFQENNLRQYITMGKPPVPEGFSRRWDDVERFRNRYRELLTHRPLQERKGKGTIFAP